MDQDIETMRVAFEAARPAVKKFHYKWHPVKQRYLLDGDEARGQYLQNEFAEWCEAWQACVAANAQAPVAPDVLARLNAATRMLPRDSLHVNCRRTDLLALLAAPIASALPAQDKERTYPSEFTDDLQWILGLICFQCIQYAQALRKGGRDIPTKAEAEQAATLDWMLRHYLRDPENWRKTAAAEMRAMAPSLPAQEGEQS